MARRVIVSAAIAAALLAAAASASSANTLSFTNRDITPADESSGSLEFSSPASSCTSVSPNSFGGTTHFQAYAFRSTPSSASDCITVTYGPPATCTGDALVISGSYVGSFDPTSPATDFAGSGAFFETCGTVSRSYSFSVPAGETFITLALTLPGGAFTNGQYDLSVAGTNVVEAQAVQASGTIAGPNTFSLRASSLPDGTAPEGTITVTGQRSAYTANVRCLRISGKQASLVAVFDGSQTGEPASIKGAVWWIEDTGDGVGAQRNSLLTQHALDTKYATCPDPTSPPTGTFNALSSGRALVVTDPAPDGST